ncbi:MAG: peptidyl-prolyl cis-trans isomerase B (cyclophilin B) [Marivirga sp.]|jgi:peptidyl-prolyl cis-trans isomerase B (cyclophilin B)
MTKQFNAILLVSIFFLAACSASKDSLVVFHTPYGDMKAILYEETPLHKENFLKLVESGQYDSTIFHRVIKDFMVQGGDVNIKKNIEADDKITYTIPAEINDQFWHVKGALAAARMGDSGNPKKASSGSQFYIVDGQTYEAQELTQMAEGRKAQQKQAKVRELLAKNKYAYLRNKVIDMQKNNDLEGLMAFMDTADSLISLEFGALGLYQFNEEQQASYATLGGAPHLDGEYTVFGRVVEGLNVIDSICAVRTAQANKPVKDIYLSVELEKMAKKKISENYGYTYPEEDK